MSKYRTNTSKELNLDSVGAQVKIAGYLQNYRDELYKYNYNEIVKISFSSKQWKMYKYWIELIITNKNKSKF